MRVSMQGKEAGSRPLIYWEDLPRAAANVTLLGTVTCVGFEEFLASYVRRLDLDVIMDVAQEERLSFFVTGKPELIDMLLTVCWLGPAAALVEDVRADFILLNDAGPDNS